MNRYLNKFLIVMKNSNILVAFLFLFTSSSFSQIDQTRKKIEDVGVEAQGLLTLRFENASNGAAVTYANITLQGNKTLLTDAEGKIRFAKKPDGVYPVQFEKKGFISEEFQIRISSGQLMNNRCMVSTALKTNEYRIVLVWDEKPADLDMHFVKEKKYRVSGKDLKKSPDSLAFVECETALGYGPESILIRHMDEIDSTKVVVIDYSNKSDESSLTLSKSNPVIKVYSTGKIEGVWKPSKKQRGNTWMVFNIQNGQIITTEEVEILIF